MLVIVSGTVAWISYQSKKTALVLTLGENDTVVVTIDPYQIRGTLNSTLNYSALSNYASITVDGSSNYFGSCFQFYYIINSIDSELLNGNLKYAITESNSLNGIYTEVASGVFASDDFLNIYEDELSPNTNYYYKSYIYLDGSTNGNSLINKTINAELRARKCPR